MANNIKLYSAEQVKTGEQSAAKLESLAMYQLMERAGMAVFGQVVSHYPAAEHILILCGSGNNGGDGYVVARLAKQQNIRVTLWHIGDPSRNQGDALLAQQAWLDIGGTINAPQNALPGKVDLIVDALLGTGLSGPVRPPFAKLINLVNRSTVPVVSVDLPSGLNANTGAIASVAINATHTVTFIGQKQGLHTGGARGVVGELTFAGLGVEKAFEQVISSNITTLNCDEMMAIRPKRYACSHKGNHGRALLLGGNNGMAGAISLASQACARCGAGLTRTLTHPNNATALIVATPEVMTEAWSDNLAQLAQHINWATAVVIGPGLGASPVAKKYFQSLSQTTLVKVVDADGLAMLAQEPNHDSQRIITPHPGEAAILLGCSNLEIEADRFEAVSQLHQRYGGVIVLKGAGTLIYDGTTTWVCTDGNAGMASGGMGDILSGVIGALLAQGLSLVNAAKLGVWLHSNAADRCAKKAGMIGLLASELLPELRWLLNRDEKSPS